jgi:hypothetical protein
MNGETTKAIQATAETVGKGIDLLAKLGDSRVAQAVSAAAAEAVGLLSIYLYHARVRILSRLVQRTREILDERHVDPPTLDEVSPSLLIPIVEAASDEAREDLQELWARLMAAALDPVRRDRVRRTFIEIVSKLEPLDALVLREMSFLGAMQVDSRRNWLAQKLGVTPDQVDVSFAALFDLGCTTNETSHGAHLSVKGRELLRLLGY